MQCLSSLLVIGHERSFYEIYKDERYCIVYLPDLGLVLAVCWHRADPLERKQFILDLTQGWELGLSCTRNIK